MQGIIVFFWGKHKIIDFYLIRAKTRPVNPKSLNFSFDDNGIPEGLNVHDILTERQGI